MAVSILDAHPNNECIDLNASEAWFSFVFCGSRIDTLTLHVYDYYTGEEIISGSPNTVYSPSIHTDLALRGGVGNGVRVNIKDFVEQANSVFAADGEYTWKVELAQNINIAKGIYPDNMVYEGALVGEPTLYANVDNVRKIDYDNYLPLTPDISKRIKPPYYVDFLDSKYNGNAYDIPITYDEPYIKDDGTECTLVRLTTYASTVKDTETLLRPAIGTRVLVHKKKNYGTPLVYTASNPNTVFIDEKIPYINKTDNENDYSVIDGCYLKVSNKYYKILSYNKATGAVTCQNGSELHNYPAGTHYSIYTSRFWTPHYYFRVHNMPTLKMGAEFHEHRRTQKEHYDDSINSLENTFNGVLFKAELIGEPHAAVKYFYWEIFDEDTNKRILKTERIYSQEMDCEFFVPFGHTYTGRITAVTQDGITLSDEVAYPLPSSPPMNDKKFKLRAIQNAFGGIELAWTYSYWYDGGSLLKANQFEVFRLEKKLNKLKYLGKVDCSPMGIDGVIPAESGSNWCLIDKSCDFSLKAPVGAKVNMYLVGGGSDGGSWNIEPNTENKSFAVSARGGQGGCFIKRSLISNGGTLQFHADVSDRNENTGTSLSVGGNTYRCNDDGCLQRIGVKGNTMTQVSGGSVIYNHNSENGENGFVTPYGYVGSSGGGGAACGGNRTNGGTKALSVSGITPKYSKGSWLLIDRESLGGETGEFDLNIPEGSTVRMHLVGGGCDGGYFRQATRDELKNPYNWDVNASMYESGSGGGYVLSKDLSISGTVHFEANIADANDVDGTNITFGGKTYNCNDKGSKKTSDTKAAHAEKNKDGTSSYYDADNGIDGVKTPYGYVGSSGGGGASNNGIRSMNGGKGGRGAGNGGMPNGNSTPTNGENAVKYGAGGGGGALRIYDYSVVGAVDRTNPGKGMPGCVIFEIISIAGAPCPAPGTGGIGAGNGGNPGEDGFHAVRYGCGGGGTGFWAADSDGNYEMGHVGRGMKGCIILEIELDGIDSVTSGEQVYCVDWTAASDKEYQYIVTGCNYESEYLENRHHPTEMIECTASVDITPHFEDFYIYFLDDADVLRDIKLNYENYETPLIEPMGRYVTSKNNNYRMIKRHNHSLALEREDKPFYRRHTWRIEGDVELGEVAHNITRNVNRLYAQMPSVSDDGTNYDTFPMSFVFGYIDCDEGNGEFVYDDQYLFELWKKCVFERQTVMIKDPKGNVWTGAFDGHSYEVEYDTQGMPYNIKTQFTQTRTEHNTRVMIVDDHNEYLKTAKGNHLR